ncbi:MAG: hypothetical protein NVSMB51_10370 [Solirubrobacteraceae bacterium]
MQALIADAPEQLATRTCPRCRNPMLAEQDWCLECGAAAPRRPAGGWGAPWGVIALTLLFVCGAVGASYAALAPTTKRTLKPRVVLARVTLPTPPVASAAAPGAAAAPTAPGTNAPLANVAPPTTLGKTPKLPKVPVAATPRVAAPLVPSTVKPLKTTKRKTPAVSNSTGAPRGQILLDTNAASTYNPNGLPDASFGDPARAIDGDQSTSWTYTLDPARAGQVGAGVLIDLKSTLRVRGMTVSTASPGMSVGFYGSSAAAVPPTITSPGWVHFADRPKIVDQATVLFSSAPRLRYLLVWITRAATGQTTGTLSLSELAALK